jgi:DNA-directed RNA polymerase specialized sigma24 family protein
MGGDVTELLRRARAGGRPALDKLLPLIYAELHRLAHAQQSNAPATLLNATALVREAYLKPVDHPDLSWPDRRRFYACAARSTRSILLAVDQALGRLAKISDRLREVVEPRVFAALELGDSAASLELNERTIFRDWRKARALLQSMLARP